MFTASNLVIYHPLGAPDDALLLCQNPRLGAERKKKKTLSPAPSQTGYMLRQHTEANQTDAQQPHHDVIIN